MIKSILAIIALLSLTSCGSPEIKSPLESLSGMVDSGEDPSYSTTKRPGYTCKYVPTKDGFLGETHAGVTLYSKPVPDLSTGKMECGVG